MSQEIDEIIEILESLLDDVLHKAKIELQIVIDKLKNYNEVEDLIQAQEHLELISNMSNVDSFTRSEIYNILSIIEGLI